MKLLVCGLIVMVTCSACAQQCFKPSEKLDILLKEHNLLRLEPGYQSSFAGSFFLGSGSIAGSSEHALTFNWEAEPNVIYKSTVPYTKVKVVIDNAKTTPTVQFYFHEQSRCDEHFPTHNLNVYVQGDLFYFQLALVVIKIREQDLIREPVKF
jgi:hypothetical protein